MDTNAQENNPGIYLKFIIFCSCVTNVFSTMEEHGIISTVQKVDLFISYENTEVVDVIVNYEFQPPVFDESSLIFDTHCTHKLSNMGLIEINKTIEEIFAYSKRIFPDLSLYHKHPTRAPRQVLIALASSAFGFISHKIYEKFYGEKHKVNNDYLIKKINLYLCALKRTTVKEDQLSIEIISQRVIIEYFSMLRYEILQISQGKIINTQLENIFKTYCADTNSVEICAKLIKCSTKMIILKGHNFIGRHNFQVQATFIIPKVIYKPAVFRTIKQFPIPTNEKNTYLLAKVENSIIETSTRSFNTENCENYLDIFVCENNYKGTKYSQKELEYEKIYSQDACITKIYQDIIIISSKVSGIVQVLDQTIQIHKFEPGILILPRSTRANTIINCGNLSRTVFFQKHKNATIYVKNNVTSNMTAIKSIKMSQNVASYPESWEIPIWLFALFGAFCVLNGIITTYAIYILKTDQKVKYIMLNKPVTDMGVNTTPCDNLNEHTT